MQRKPAYVTSCGTGQNLMVLALGSDITYFTDQIWLTWRISMNVSVKPVHSLSKDFTEEHEQKCCVQVRNIWTPTHQSCREKEASVVAVLSKERTVLDWKTGSCKPAWPHSTIVYTSSFFFSFFLFFFVAFLTNIKLMGKFGTETK